MTTVRLEKEASPKSEVNALQCNTKIAAFTVHHSAIHASQVVAQANVPAMHSQRWGSIRDQLLCSRHMAGMFGNGLFLLVVA